MTQQVTKARLEGKISMINSLLGHPADAGYGTPGLVVLSGAYGGFSVHRYSGEHGGRSDLMGYHGTKRECGLFLDGMRQALYIVTDPSL